MGVNSHGLDSYFRDLTEDELIELDCIVGIVSDYAHKHAHKRPKITTLMEEMSELYLSARGKHEHTIELELLQVASVAVNLLWQRKMYGDSIINNVVTIKSDAHA